MGKDVSNEHFIKELSKQILVGYFFDSLTPDSLANTSDGFLVPTPANWTKSAEKFNSP